MRNIIIISAIGAAVFALLDCGKKDSPTPIALTTGAGSAAVNAGAHISIAVSPAPPILLSQITTGMAAGQQVDLLEGQVYTYDKTVDLPDGVTLNGHGAVINVLAGNTSNALGVITSTGRTGIQVKDLTINCNATNAPNGPQRGIFFQGATNSRIENVVINDPREGGVRLHYGSTGNVIEHVTVVMALDPAFDGGQAIDHDLVGIYLVSATMDQYNGYGDAALSGTGALPATTVDNTVCLCKITGGRHGVMTYNSNNTTIAANDISWTSHRGVIMSPTANNNTVIYNYIHDYGSTGILFAYGSEYNTARYNTVHSDHTLWQRDGIKGQFAANNNAIEYNDISGNNINGVNLATGSQHNSVRYNTIADALIGTSEQQQIPTEIQVTVKTTDNVFSDNQFTNVQVIYKSL